MTQGNLDASEKLAKIIQVCLEDGKAEEMVTIDLAGKTAMADFMIIASGRSNTHVSALADQAVKAFKKAGTIPRLEGMPHCDWVLIDGGDLIVHLFRPEVREFYNLEKMWSDDRPVESDVLKRQS